MEKIEKRKKYERVYTKLEKECFYFGLELWFEFAKLVDLDKFLEDASPAEKKAFSNGVKFALNHRLS